MGQKGRAFKGHRKSRSRTVGYHYTGDFSESEVEPILEKARDAGVVTEFDTGRGRICWFNGHPGPELREVRDQVRRIVEAKPPRP
jgi:hypothetical protein